MDNIVKGLPITCDWFLNDVCNNRCTYCNYVRFMEREGHNISLEDFKKYADRLKQLGVQGINVVGGGEPTICPDFEKMMAYLDRIGMKYILVTNFNEFRECKPVSIKISLDAWDDESYKAKRGVARYTKVRENIIRYAKWRDIHSIDTNIGIQLVTCDTSEIMKFYEGNKDLPVNYISIRPIESMDGTFYKDGDSAEEQIRIVKELAEKDSRVMLNYKWEERNRKFKECYAHPLQIAINWNGEVMACCHRPFDIIGHIMDDDILYKNRNTRFDMTKCDVPCRMSGANRLLEQINNGCKDKEFI